MRDWVEIPGGAFHYQDGERRQLETFRISRYPVTSAQFQAFGDAGPHYLARTTAVGIYPQGASPEGVLDLSGNVWEWCLNEYDKPGRTQPAGSESRVVRGGSWNNNQDNARADYRNDNHPNNRNDNIGFRVLCASHIHLLCSKYRHVRPTKVCRMRGAPMDGAGTSRPHVVHGVGRLSKRDAVRAQAPRRLTARFDAWRGGRISFAEFDSSVSGWINHVRYADSWGLREHVLSRFVWGPEVYRA